MYPLYINTFRHYINKPTTIYSVLMTLSNAMTLDVVYGIDKTREIEKYGRVMKDKMITDTDN